MTPKRDSQPQLGNMPSQAWLAGHGVRDSEIGVVARSLQAMGCNVSLQCLASPCPAVILLYRIASDSLLDQVRATVRHQIGPIIGAKLDDQRDAQADVAQLLDAGVWDLACIGPNAGAIDVLAAKLSRWAAVEAALRLPTVAECTVGQNRQWLQLKRHIAEAAMYSQAPILLLGESGTGKEQLARMIHLLDRQTHNGRLVVLDCTTLSPELSGSEFFGHDKGSFTGAIAQREGAFALAHDGTLFLDEVGELPAALQAQLLRVVQEKTYKRLGSNNWYESNFRLVSATNRNLEDDVANKTFRFDFLQRIGTWTFRVAPLRERSDDIPLLAGHFARQLLGDQFVGLDPGLVAYLLDRSFRGNTRELQQLVTRICARYAGTGPLSLHEVSAFDLPVSCTDHQERDSLSDLSTRSILAGQGLKDLLREVRKAAIGCALAESQQNIQQAARLLKVTDRALQMELAKRESGLGEDKAESS